MCCSMTCWDCMIMQDSDIIVSSRPDDEESELVYGFMWFYAKS